LKRILERELCLQAGRLKAQADVQVKASVFRGLALELALELTLAAMAPYAATEPVAAQAPATLEVISPTAGVTRPRTRWQAGAVWMAMAAAEAKAVKNIRRFAEFVFFWTKPQHDCWRA
jgi:hypothetical protein